MSTTPHDLLPIIRPIEDAKELPETYFYDNVVQHLIKDIVRIEANGIPVCLDSVQELEVTLTDILKEVRSKLSNNKAMVKFLEIENTANRNNKIKSISNKKKSAEDFIKPLDISNKTHRTYVVNTYLEINGKDNMTMPVWSIKDLRKLNNIIASKVITDILNKDISNCVNKYADVAMMKLATDKAELFNRNNIETKITKIEEAGITIEFNPKSPLQKQKLFEYYGINSESKTAKGNQQWDRAELEKLQKLLATLIDIEESASITK